MIFLKKFESPLRKLIGRDYPPVPIASLLNDTTTLALKSQVCLANL